MMPLKITNMKFINKQNTLCTLLFWLVGSMLYAQPVPDSTNVTSATKFNRDKRIDGVVGVVGDHVILESVIDKAYLEIRSRGLNVNNFSCRQLFGHMLDDKIYAHNTFFDSV